MFRETRYLAWARRHYTSGAALDLASSGIPSASAEEAFAADANAPPLDDPSAYARLVQSIADYTHRPVTEVVPALGTTQALFLAYAALLSPGDDLLVESPGYEPLTRIAEGLGARGFTFPREETRGFSIDPEAVAARMTPRTRAVVVSSLHNPSGVRAPDDTLRELARITDARGAYLVVDEVYAPFDGTPSMLAPRASARNLGPNVVAVSSLTKCYGLGMARIGWLLGPEAITEGARNAALATHGHLPLAHAALAVRAFANLDALGARARAILAGKRALAAAWVQAHADRGVRWSAPTAGLFGLVTLPPRADLTADIEALIARAGVLVAPGAFFGAKDAFRLAWAATDPTRFAEGLDRLEALVRGV